LKTLTDFDSLILIINRPHFPFVLLATGV